MNEINFFEDSRPDGGHVGDILQFMGWYSRGEAQLRVLVYNGEVELQNQLLSDTITTTDNGQFTFSFKVPAHATNQLTVLVSDLEQGFQKKLTVQVFEHA